jgi:hypothetical protein
VPRDPPALDALRKVKQAYATHVTNAIYVIRADHEEHAGHGCRRLVWQARTAIRGAYAVELEAKLTELID